MRVRIGEPEAPVEGEGEEEPRTSVRPSTTGEGGEEGAEEGVAAEGEEGEAGTEPRPSAKPSETAEAAPGEEGAEPAAEGEEAAPAEAAAAEEGEGKVSIQHVSTPCFIKRKQYLVLFIVTRVFAGKFSPPEFFSKRI